MKKVKFYKALRKFLGSKCQRWGHQVVVPNTASNVSPLTIVIGLLMTVAGSGVFALRKQEIL